MLEIHIPYITVTLMKKETKILLENNHKTIHRQIFSFSNKKEM